MRSTRNGHRVLLALGACATLMMSCGPRDTATPADTVEGLYRVLIDSLVSGAPTESQLAAMAPFLGSELHELLQGASARRNRDLEEFPDEEPSYADGNLFTSLFEGPTSLAILADTGGTAARRLAVRFTYDRVPPTITWVDTVIVAEEEGRLVVTDVAYGGTWAFANRGSLLGSLRAALRPSPLAGDPPRIPWTLRLDGFGPVRVGMTLAELEPLLGGTVRIERIEPDDACGYAYLSAMPTGTSVMLDGTTIVRIHVDTTGIVTESGIAVGDTELDVLARHAGRIRVEEHPYTGPEGHYLIVEDPARPGYRLILESDGTRVINFRAGRLPEVDLIEGCA